MARMTREFTLVLLGAGVLTAGSFLWPDEDLNARAEVQAQEQVASSNSTGQRRYYSGGFFFIPMGRYGGGSFATGGVGGVGRAAGISSGGFGGIGRSVGAAS